jgi:hypothetical protein
MEQPETREEALRAARLVCVVAALGLLAWAVIGLGAAGVLV